MAASVSWNYNGGDTCTVVCTGLTPSVSYALYTNDPVTPYPTGTSDGSGNLTLSAVGIGGLSAGDLFYAQVERATGASRPASAMILKYGTASTADQGIAATWAYDGGGGGSGVLSVTFTSAIGITYGLTGLSGSTPTVVGDGTSKTLTITDLAPGSATPFAPILYKTTGSPPTNYAIRIFDLGTASSGHDGVAAPPADFEGAPLSGHAPLTVAFTDLSTGSPTSWLWDFGDGATSVEQNPVHVYSVGGIYDVSLTVDDVYIHVEPGYVVAAGGAHVVEVKLYDLETNLLADITPIALEKTLRRRLNQTRSFVVTAPAGHALLTSVADDGYPNLRMGNRKLLVWEDGNIIFHGRVFTVERNGDGTQNLVTITAHDPWMELGYDADDRAGRPVRDEGGNLIDPSFSGSGVGGPDKISGPDLIRQVLANSQNGDPTLGEGPLPIDLDSGVFDIDVPPAVDLSVIDSMDWPVLCGDFISQLVDTNVVDVDMRPVDPSEGFDPYVMVELSARSILGVDRSGTVHFDYWTGSRNAMACRHVEEFSTINNKLVDELGPRLDIEHWRANIAPDSPGVIPDPAASRALYGGPDGGQFMSIRVYDSIGDEASNRPLYMALYNAELGLRLEPRQMLFITPNPDAKALFEAPQNFDVFDTVAVNIGSVFGVTLAEVQRVHGYDKTWDRQGVARISELLTSADLG